MASLEPDDGPLPAPTTTRTMTPTAARSRSRRSNASTSSSRHSSRAVSIVRTAEQAIPQIGEPGPSGLSAVPSSSLPSEALATTDPGPSSNGGVGWSSGPLTEEIQTMEEVPPVDQEDGLSNGKGKKRKAAEAAIEDAIYGEGAARRRRNMNGKGKAVASDPADDSAEEDISSPAPDAEVAIASDSELLQSALPATTSLPVVAPPEARVPASEPQYLHTYNCSVCLAPPKNATLIPCGHIFCGECLFTSVRIAMRNITPYGTTMARCPLCRTHIPGWDGHGGGVIGLKPKTITTISDLDL
ncbi:hypothetical protein PENSPDRAFT_181734 [Peniophora sp. CONT]|nr:hypothetical protein PENSPDRAFT_181734 [Peniophora sp. CONT]